MSKLRFFQIGDTFFNVDFVKRFQCDDERCTLTDQTARGDDRLDEYTYEWRKDDDPGRYQDARKNWLTLKRIHRTNVFNTPMDLLEKEAY